MRALLRLLVVGAAVLGVVLGASLPWQAAVPVALVVGVVAAQLVSRLTARRLQRVTSRVRSWVGDQPRGPVPVVGSPSQRELAIALNTLGTGYRQRGERLGRERPWRAELVDSLVGPALLFGDNGRLLVANGEARDLLGIAGDATQVTVVQALGSSALAGAVREARRLGRPVHVEADVGERSLRATASVVGDETLVIVTDRTLQRQIAALRRDFVANASHELKTPVTSIQTLSEAIAVVLERDPDRAARLLDRLRAESERLARLVHHLLDLRRLEDRDPHAHEAVELVGVIRDVLAEIGPQAEARDIELHLDLPDHATIVGVVDDMRLVVSNLVANAVTYNHDGGKVFVAVHYRDSAYELSVRDTGIGIAQADRARVFERFYRVDAARSRKSRGTGLGLSIVRHAVERHGGRIQLDSLLGEGSTFTVTLPVEPAR